MTPEARAARERKQKIFVVVGGLLLVGLLAIQLPKLMGGSGSSTASTTTTVETTPGEAGAPATPSTPDPSSSGGATPVALVDTDRPLPLLPGQLRSFSGYKMKDPFVQQVVERAPEPAAPVRPKTTKRKPAAPSKDFSQAKKVKPGSVTVISVNGVRHALAPGGKFPTSSPVFVLVSVKPGAKTAVVGIPGGKYANGARTTTLEVGKPLVLVNSKTKTRYRLLLVQVPAAKSGKPS